jgi:predicted anti-sigma-YlaC factor YlaD
VSDSSVLACARVRVLLEPYVDGDLAQADPALAIAVREHLAGCADCRRQHDQAMSVPFRLKALTSPRPPESLVGEVMRAVASPRRAYRRAWTLLAPEAVLATFIVWYLSGLDGLTTLASGIFGDLQRLAGWGSGTGSLPTVPRSDVVLLVALIALTVIAAYHLSLLIQLAPATRRTVRE